MKKTLQNKKGFSLVELIIVIAIMAVLIAILAPNYLRYVEKSRRTKALSNAKNVIDTISVVLTEKQAFNDPDFQTAFSLINSINKRARNYTENVKSDSLAFSAYSSNKEEMEKLLMLERKREFMFEGKRWFDLVRKSLRDGNTNYLANEATKKQKENAVAIKIQFADINTIFWPYNREELKKNTLLKQNSAYSDTEDFQK